MNLSAKKTMVRVQALLAAILVLGLLAANGASATTQHWASAPKGSTTWKALTAGVSQSYGIAGAGVSTLNLSGKLWGITTEINCGGFRLNGTVENPSGGGSGTMSGELSMGNCSIEEEPFLACFVQITAAPLKYTVLGSPTVEIAPVSGERLLTIVISHNEGEPECLRAGTWVATGQIPAKISESGVLSFPGTKKETTFFIDGTRASIGGSGPFVTPAGELLRLE